MNNWQKKWIIITGFICIVGIYLLKNNGITLQIKEHFFPFQQTQDTAENLYFPNIMFSQKSHQFAGLSCKAGHEHDSSGKLCGTTAKRRK